MWIQHLGTRFIGGFGSVRIMVGSNDLRDSFQLKWSYDSIHICTFCCIGSCSVQIESWSFEESHSCLHKYFPILSILDAKRHSYYPSIHCEEGMACFYTLLHLSQRRISLTSLLQWRVSRAQVEQETSIVSSELRTLFPMEILKSQQKCRGLVW